MLALTMPIITRRLTLLLIKVAANTLFIVHLPVFSGL